jgi:putative hydroxymethylpyrimidine transport system substrate-binding protein
MTKLFYMGCVSFSLLLMTFIYPTQTFSAEGIKKEKLTVLLDWFVNPDHGPLFIAQENGYFSDLNLEVEFIAPSDPNDPPKLVAAGQAEIAVSYQPQLYLQSAAGLPLKRFGTLISTPLNTLLTLADGPVKSISDLKGRKIGVSVAGFEEALLGSMLNKYGLKLSDVTLINVNFSLSPSLLSGQVDAVMGAYRNFELNQLKIEGHKGHAFYPEEEGVPPYDELIFIANTDITDNKILRLFIDSIEKATQFIINHPKQSWEIFIKNRPELNNQLNKLAWFDTLPRFALRPAALDTARYLRFSKFMRSQDLIKSEINIEEYAIELVH